MTKNEPKHLQTERDLVSAFADLFDQVQPTTPEEIDRTLRSEGYDPDQVAKRIAAVASQAATRSPLNWMMQYYRQLYDKQGPAMTEIDELEGVVLSEAVALALGWDQLSFGWWWDGDRSRYIGDRKNASACCIYRPDLDIAQAWELLEELWESKYDYAINRLRFSDGRYAVSLAMTDPAMQWEWETTFGPTKSTAICRAFLKAKRIK